MWFKNHEFGGEISVYNLDLSPKNRKLELGRYLFVHIKGCARLEVVQLQKKWGHYFVGSLMLTLSVHLPVVYLIFDFLTH